MMERDAVVAGAERTSETWYHNNQFPKKIERACVELGSGHELVTINKRPHKMLVLTVRVRGVDAKQLVYKEESSGINLVIAYAITEGILQEALSEELCMRTKIFIHLAASIWQRVKMNNYKAMCGVQSIR